MHEKVNTSLSIQNDSFYNTLIDLAHKKRLTFADAYQIKQYLIEEDVKRTTKVDEKVIEYIHKNLKDWHTLVTNTNASKIFLILNESAKNNYNLCKILKLGEPTIRHWVSQLKKISLVELNEFNYGIEKMHRKNDLFEHGNDLADLIKIETGPPKDRLKLRILGITAFFCMHVLEHRSVEMAKKKIKEDFSFMVTPVKKEVFLNAE